MEIHTLIQPSVWVPTLYGLPTSYLGECHNIVPPYSEAGAHQRERHTSKRRVRCPGIDQGLMWVIHTQPCHAERSEASLC